MSKKESGYPLFRKFPHPSPIRAVHVRDVYDYHDLAEKYFLAARYLRDHAVPRRAENAIFLPTMTLLRQAYELQLKALIIQIKLTRAEFGLGSKETVPDNKLLAKLRKEFGHNLQRLVTEVQLECKAFDSDIEIPGNVISLIKELHLLDTAGTAFRYGDSFRRGTSKVDFLVLFEELADGFFDLQGVSINVATTAKEMFRKRDEADISS